MKPLSTLFHKPVSIDLAVTSANGFHLRPAAKFASEAKLFGCDIHIEFTQKKVSAKAVNAILSLNLDTGDTFRLIAHGKEAQKALETLRGVFDLLMKTDSTPIQITKQHSNYEGQTHQGDIICEGIAIGKLHRFSSKEIPGKRLDSFEQAINKSAAALETLYTNSQKSSDSHIYLAQKELLLSLAQEADSLESFTMRIAQEENRLKQGRHASKISDLNDLLQRVKTHMGYRYEVVLPRTPFILVSDNLLPSQIKILEGSTVMGVILTNSTLTSHTAILLRASGIPSLLLPQPIAKEEDKVILDGYSGVLIIDPTPKDLMQAFNRQSHDEQAHLETYAKRFEPAITQEGKPIKILANISDLESALTAKEEGAQGVGLLRSEFLFKEHKPLIRDQVKAYKAIFDLFEDVTVRTLDVGGDKTLPYIDLPKEENPFLGIRGIRILQTHPEIIAQQLEAIFIAAENRPIKVMFPMISTPQEFTQAKVFALDIARQKDIAISQIQFGIMVEVPSVLFSIPKFNEVVDFYSIGTNDLAQYLFAIERTHPTLKINPLSPVLFDAIEKIAKEATKPISICGELAAEKKAIPALLKIGIESLSVSPKQIPHIKKTIRNV